MIKLSRDVGDNTTIVAHLDKKGEVQEVDVLFNGSERLKLGHIFNEKCVLSSSCLSSKDLSGSHYITIASKEAFDIFRGDYNKFTLGEMNYKEET
tara:strand:- start:2055 stop:2339 length:285 start_codon:yes stop_codon:yes gene_type:complete